MNPLILASTSPRREMVMRLLELDFEIEPPDFDEVLDQSIPWGELVCGIALGKARSVAFGRDDDAIVIGADTFLNFDDQYMGKVATEDEARRRLHQMNGKPVPIATGLAVINTMFDSEYTVAIETIAHIKNLSDDEIDKYIADGHHIGKAGAISIEAVDYIEGEHSAALGLPLSLLSAHLRDLGFDTPK